MAGGFSPQGKSPPLGGHERLVAAAVEDDESHVPAFDQGFEGPDQVGAHILQVRQCGDLLGDRQRGPQLALGARQLLVLGFERLVRCLQAPGVILQPRQHAVERRCQAAGFGAAFHRRERRQVVLTDAFHGVGQPEQRPREAEDEHLAGNQRQHEDRERDQAHLEPELTDLFPIRLLRKPDAQCPGPAAEDGPGDVEEPLALLGDDFFKMSSGTLHRRIAADQFDRHAPGEGVADHGAVPHDEDVRHGRVDGHLGIEQALQAHQVVDEHLLGRIQGQFVGGVFGLGNGALHQADAVAVGDQLRDQDAADEDQDRDREQERVSKALRAHGRISRYPAGRRSWRARVHTTPPAGRRN